MLITVIVVNFFLRTCIANVDPYSLINNIVHIRLEILGNYKIEVGDLIRSCFETEEINKRIELVYAINNLIPIAFQIQMPSLITNNYIDQALYTLEERLSSEPLSR